MLKNIGLQQNKQAAERFALINNDGISNKNCLAAARVCLYYKGRIPVLTWGKKREFCRLQPNYFVIRENLEVFFWLKATLSLR